jgi:hypothetical protein
MNNSIFNLFTNFFKQLLPQIIMNNSVFFYNIYRFIGFSFIVVPLLKFKGFHNLTIIGILILASSYIRM